MFNNVGQNFGTTQVQEQIKIKNISSLLPDDTWIHIFKMLTLNFEIWKNLSLVDKKFYVVCRVPSISQPVLKSVTRTTKGYHQRFAKISGIHLITYSLRGCALTTEELIEILSSCSRSNLKSLRIVRQPVTNHVLQKYVTQFFSLESLQLRECQITDADLEHLKALTSLQSLDLDGCHQITDKGLKHLAILSSLTYLDVIGCNKITNQGLEKLVQQIGSKLEITREARVRIVEAYALTSQAEY